MKSAFLAAGVAAAGYLLGTRAGRERRDALLRAGRRVTGSQTVQATAGVVRAQVENRVRQTRTGVANRLAADGTHPADDCPRP